MTNERRPSGYERNGWQWQRTVARIINRDNGTCYLCNKPGADTADHVIPVSQAGRRFTNPADVHRDTNLRAAHRNPCHADKTERERLAALSRRSRRRPVRPNPNLT